MGGECGTLGEGKDTRTGSWVENLKVGNYMDDLGIDGKIIFKLILKKQAGKTSIGFIWLRILTRDRDV
jgi:hypothetical protein